MTAPPRRELREELARAMCHATRNNRGCTTRGDPCATGCKCPADYLVTNEYADAVLPILARELAAARKAERERCAEEVARCLWNDDGEYEAIQRATAAIRALED